MTATKLTVKEITARIREIEAEYSMDGEKAMCMGHDEGTTAKGVITHTVYETTSGERYAVQRNALGGTYRRMTPEAAEESTEGRIRYSQDAARKSAGLRAELARLRKQLAAAK